MLPFDDLSPSETMFMERLARVFSLVNPQKPEKGLVALITRARNLAKETGRPLEDILEEVYQGAKERTERRVHLLSQCRLQARNDSKPPDV